jgi:hypothetical protein
MHHDGRRLEVIAGAPRTDVPLVPMTTSTVYRIGYENFAARCAEVGAMA